MDKKGKRLNCKVSIITVSFNSVKTIEQTIKSVINQTYKNIEYILLDGASTDGTQQIIEKYKDRISYYVSEKDSGLYYAMNKGIEIATGDIVGIINSDDWYAQDAVQSVIDSFQQDEPDLVYGKIICVSSDGTERIVRKTPLDKIWYSMAVSHPSVFVKKKIYNEFGTFNTNYKCAADYELMLRFFSVNLTFRYIDKVIAYFRLGGITTTRFDESRAEAYKISMSYMDKCPYKDKAIIEIKEHHKWLCFANVVENDGNIICNLLRKNLADDIKSIIIFGIGIWGERCYEALLQSDIAVAFFADNNSSRWNTQFHDTYIIKPSELKNMDAYVLIAVKEHGNEIKEQLNRMENDALKCVTINELMKMYWNRR